MNNQSDSESGGVEDEDVEWDRAIDNAVILMCLLIGKVELKRWGGRWGGSKLVVSLVLGRIDKLIALYRDPGV